MGADDESIDQRSEAATPARDWPRRRFLQGLGIASAAAGGLALGGSPSARAVTADPGPAGDHTAQPQETGWSPKQPPLTTPWTADVSATNARPEYPRPQLTRDRWLSLNGVWQFDSLAAGAEPAPGNDLSERILVPYPAESALSGIMRHESRMVYRRRFRVPSSWQVGTGRGTVNRLLIHFDAIDYQAKVIVNGRAVGSHRGGYDRFTVDVTDALNTAGHSGRPTGLQELLVVVDDATEDGVQPLGKQRVGAIDPTAPHSSLYYTPTSGIWQSVWLEPVPTVYVQDVVVAPDIGAHLARVRVEVAGTDDARVEVTAYDGRRKVGSATGHSGKPIEVHIPDPELWTPDHPFLYGLEVELLSVGTRRNRGVDHRHGGDRVRSYLGMREITVAKLGGAPHLLLNGEFLVQLSCLQQGFWPDGIYTAATDDALRFDIEQAKRLGFNTIRKHQKLEPDRWYHLADTLGMLVWQDMPATATGRQPPNQQTPATPPAAGQREFERELRNVVRQFRAFPSIVMWIPFNEGWGAYDLARVAAEVRRWDPTRIVDELSGTTTADYDEGGGQVLDWHNLRSPYPGPVPPVEDDRAVLIGEFGAFGYPVAGHEWSPGHSTPNQDVAGAAALTEAYVRALNTVAGFITGQGLSGANYNLFEDAELQVNGLFTYDRRVFKADSHARVTAANRKVIAAGRIVRRGHS